MTALDYAERNHADLSIDKLNQIEVFCFKLKKQPKYSAGILYWFAKSSDTLRWLTLGIFHGEKNGEDNTYFHEILLERVMQGLRKLILDMISVLENKPNRKRKDWLYAYKQRDLLKTVERLHEHKRRQSTDETTFLTNGDANIEMEENSPQLEHEDVVGPEVSGRFMPRMMSFEDRIGSMAMPPIEEEYNEKNRGKYSEMGPRQHKSVERVSV